MIGTGRGRWENVKNIPSPICGLTKGIALSNDHVICASVIPPNPLILDLIKASYMVVQVPIVPVNV